MSGGILRSNKLFYSRFHFKSRKQTGTVSFVNPRNIFKQTANRNINTETMATIQQMKATLRKELKSRIAKIPDAVKETQSHIVVQKLLQHPRFKESQRISIYLNMNDEIRTIPLLKTILSERRKCFIPHYVGNNMKMVPLLSWEDYEKLPETKWKIKQPPDDDMSIDALETGGLDTIVMPGLGFTRDGDRIGRGKGYYDSYLTKCHDRGHHPFTVALAYQEQICDEIPTSVSDRKIDLVITPEEC